MASLDQGRHLPAVSDLQRPRIDLALHSLDGALVVRAVTRGERDLERGRSPVRRHRTTTN